MKPVLTLSATPPYVWQRRQGSNVFLISVLEGCESNYTSHYFYGVIDYFLFFLTKNHLYFDRCSLHFAGIRNKDGCVLRLNLKFGVTLVLRSNNNEANGGSGSQKGFLLQFSNCFFFSFIFINRFHHQTRAIACQLSFCAITNKIAFLSSNNEKSTKMALLLLNNEWCSTLS